MHLKNETTYQLVFQHVDNYLYILNIHFSPKLHNEFLLVRNIFNINMLTSTSEKCWMKNNMTFCYYILRTRWYSGETNLLLVHFLNLFQQVLWRYSGFCLSSWYSIIEQPTFLLPQNSSMRSFKDESLGIPALMLPLQWYFLFINC